MSSTSLARPRSSPVKARGHSGPPSSRNTITGVGPQEAGPRFARMPGLLRGISAVFPPVGGPAEPARAVRQRRTSQRPSLAPRRLVFTFVVLTLLFGLMGARLFMLQVVENDEFQQIAAEQRLTKIEFPARRGTVLDRDAETLSISVDLQVVYSDPTLIDDPSAVAAELGTVLRESPESLVDSLTGTFEGDQFEYVARQVDPNVAKEIEAMELPGIFLEAEPKRFYPNGRTASHVVGFVNIDGSVMEGVEAQYNEVLAGKPGVVLFEKDSGGLQLPQADSSYEQPEPGHSILLTIDKDIQYFTETALMNAVTQFKADFGDRHRDAAEDWRDPRACKPPRLRSQLLQQVLR